MSCMYAPHEHAQHLCHRVISMACPPTLSELRRACPGFLTVPQGGMSAAPARGVRRRHNSRYPVSVEEKIAPLLPANKSPTLKSNPLDRGQRCQLEFLPATSRE